MAPPTPLAALDPATGLTAENVIATLDLQAHPEGGWYREYWRGPDAGGRATGTAIYYLLERGQRSHWHRIDASELWLYQAGGPLRLLTVQDGSIVAQLLGPGIGAAHTLHGLVAPSAWQSATCEGDWTLVSCVVTPGFEFSKFEMAPPGWAPGPND